MYYPPLLPSHTQHVTADSGRLRPCNGKMAGSLEETWANHANSKQHIEQISNNKQHITVRTGGVLYFNTYTTHNTYRTSPSHRTPACSRLQPAQPPTGIRQPPTANRDARCVWPVSVSVSVSQVAALLVLVCTSHKSTRTQHKSARRASCGVRPGPRCNTHGARRPLAHAHAATGRNPARRPEFSASAWRSACCNRCPL
jgi:hypothetical protein